MISYSPLFAASDAAATPVASASYVVLYTPVLKNPSNGMSLASFTSRTFVPLILNLGRLSKPSTNERADSTNICFISAGDFSFIISATSGARPGNLPSLISSTALSTCWVTLSFASSGLSNSCESLLTLDVPAFSAPVLLSFSLLFLSRSSFLLLPNLIPLALSRSRTSRVLEDFSVGILVVSKSGVGLLVSPADRNPAILLVS